MSAELIRECMLVWIYLVIYLNLRVQRVAMLMIFLLVIL